MEISCYIDNEYKVFKNVNPICKLRDFLYEIGCYGVRDSDDSEGFCGSDTVLLNGIPVFSNFILLGECDGCDIKTSHGLSNANQLNVVQESLIKAGVVQSAYNSPATALILSWLLENNKNPTKEDIKDALTGIFIRDAGYEHYYLAVKLAMEKLKFGEYKTEITKTFRKNLRSIGKPVSKIDGPELVRGDKAFVEDYIDKNSLHLVMLRSPHAHAYINSIDISKAIKLRGVVDIITAFNCPDIYYMQAGQGNPEPSPHDRRLFNYKVRHVGDRVAAVIAESVEIAKKAIKLIKVDYEVLKPVFTIEEAMAKNAPLVHNGVVQYNSGAPDDLEEYNKKAGDKREGKVIYQFPLNADIRHNVAAANKGGIGDVEKAFKESDCVIERTYQTSQVQHAPLEPHLAFAKIDRGRLTVIASTQVPFHVRRICSWVTGLPENKIHVIKTRVGGGYGAKQDILIEDVVAYAAYKLGKPVYCRNTRKEEFFANSTRHPMRVKVKIGGNKDGKITGIFLEVRANTGPYGNHCLTVPMNSCSKTLPLFKCDNMAYDLKILYTNIPPTGAYQGYGTPKGTFGIMMAVAELADKLKLDLADILLKNHVNEGYMLEILKGLGEGREGAVVPVGSCGLKQCIQQGLKMINWGKKEISKDKNWKIGKGFAIIMQGSGLPGLDHAEALAKLTTDGNVILNSGGADIGTGLDTISAKIVNEVLCLPFDNITILSGDTDSSVFDTGSYASSGTFFSGNASLLAVKNLKEKILKEASLQLNENIKDLELCYPGYVYSKKTGKKLTYYDISHAACQGDGRGELIAHGIFTTNASSVPYGAHFAQVAVNIRTGEIKVQKFYALQDAGTPINPEIASCQIYGAVMKSIGHTLYENMVLDKKGLNINTTMTDYSAPMINEAPDDFKTVLIDINDKYGPYGAKSISEIACNGAAPAIGIAIHDACGVWIRDWPMTPEKILKKLKKF